MVSMLWIQIKIKSPFIKGQKKTSLEDKSIMYKNKPIQKTQWFKIFEMLNNVEETTADEISKTLNIPLPTVRRIMCQFDQIGRIEKRTTSPRCFYKLKTKQR